MGGRKYSIDPYIAMLKQSERKAVIYGLSALMTLVMEFIVTSPGDERAGHFAPLVEQVRYTAGLGMLFACGVFSLMSLWFIGRYVYFLKWPERFE